MTNRAPDGRNPAATVYPDSDKIAIWTGGDRSDDLITTRSSRVDYYFGETEEDR